MCAFAEGLIAHGHEVQVEDAEPPADIFDFVVWWGDKAPPIIRDNYPRLILEAGFINGRSGDYVTDRLQFVSAGWNGLHGRADPGPLDRPPNRWLALGEALLPWRRDGAYFLVCDQHPGDSCAPGESVWWSELDQWSRPDLGSPLPIVYRPHPLLAPNLRPLARSLSRAAICITWSSTCAIQAVLMGVPTIALDRGSMAWPVTSHGFDEAAYLGDRSQWAYNLAYRQWTHEELADGSAWEYMKYGIENKS